MKLTTTGKLLSVMAGVSMSTMLSAATILAPTDGDVNTFELPFGEGREEYALFRTDDDLVVQNAFFIAANERLVFEFSDSTSQWSVERTADVPGVFVLGDTPFSVDVQIIPVPAAVWLFGFALGLLGWIRRRTS